MQTGANDDDRPALQAMLAAALVRVLAAGSYTWASTELTMPQLKVLLLLSDAGSAPVNWLAAHTRVSSPNITGIAGRLEERGWVRRRVDRQDRRVVQVSLTPSGDEMLQQVCFAGVEAVGAGVRALEPDDARMLQQGLRALLEAIAALEQHDAPPERAALVPQHA